jgi:hypothetical protein
MKITTTLNRLKKAGACAERYKHLVSELGEAASDRNAPIDALFVLDHNGFADVQWLLQSSACIEDPATAWRAYEEAKATAWRAYEEAKATARRAYEEATATAWRAYEEAKATAWRAYEEAKATGLRAILAEGAE